jgi:hypothetical protein
MVADQSREQDALEWSEALIVDFSLPEEPRGKVW